MTKIDHIAPMLQRLRASHAGKVVSAAEAVQLIRSHDTVATGGFVGIGFAEGIAVALEERFLAETWPRLVDETVARGHFPFRSPCS